ncbi:hypothetical protein CHU98_g9835 [Xylaria longipes]|nr:hypothetical protein CHU98_g9835 [Xylaria longipes]
MMLLQAVVNKVNCQRSLAEVLDIWHLFKPGDFVMERDSRHSRQAYRVISVISTPHKGSVNAKSPWLRFLKDHNGEEREECICIDCVYVDFDGVSLGPVQREFKIKRFEGEKIIKSLDLCPLNMPEDREIWEKLKERGRNFLDVAGVMVDFEEAFLVNGQERWRPIIDTFAPPQVPEVSDKCDAECCPYQNVHDDAYVDQRRNEEFIASLFPPRNGGSRHSLAIAPRSLTETARDSTSDEELVIMSYRAFGFGLSSRAWAASKEQRTAFDELVLPKGSQHKHIVKSLIAQHFKDKERELTSGESDQPDMIRGKGKGLILLLHGAPGVGKTTTAEGVAEFFRRPLFQITCAKEVESVLVKHFALANKWGCILLLDEADVFLSQRDRLDFKRNGLVAVFLHILEYYAGVLFLTTNRLGDFDEAFASRIHMSLHYPDLDQDSTRKVFELNLERIRKRRGDKVDHGEVPNEQQPTYQNQPQPSGVANPPRGYGIGNAGGPGVSYQYQYYPPQGSSSGYAPAIHVEVPPLEQPPQSQPQPQPQPPQGWLRNPTGGVATTVNPQYGSGGTAVPGVVPMADGYVNTNIAQQMAPPANSNLAMDDFHTVSERSTAFYGQQHQGQAGFPGTQGGYLPGQVQMNSMNQPATNQSQINPSQHIHQLQGNQQQIEQLAGAEPWHNTGGTEIFSTFGWLADVARPLPDKPDLSAVIHVAKQIP